MRRRSFLKSGVMAGLAAWGWSEGVVPAAAAPANRPLRLNANENPRGLPPASRDAVRRAIEQAGRYPFQQMDAMTAALARQHGVQNDQIVLGNGSSEVLQMAVQALRPPDGKLVLAAPTFEAAADCATALGVQTVAVPLRRDHSHDLDAMRREAESSDRGALVYLCNPNNPTGTLTPREEIEAWLDTARPDTVFLLDEAYFDYVEDPLRWSGVERAGRQPNLVATRTFSKVFGMAGLRLGYGVAEASTAKKMRAFASDINTNSLALAAGLAALGQSRYRSESVQLNRRGKKILQEALTELDLGWIPSQTNFVMHRIAGDLDRHIERMKEAGILVGRPFPPLLDHCRVSIGLPEEMERWADQMRRFRKKGWA